MRLWAKVVVIPGLSILLMGSKIIIQVPAGGSVVSSSGLFACSAGEECTIEVNERHFAETFTAVADAGYRFRHWGDESGGLCRGSRDPYCAELDDGPFSDFASDPGARPAHRKAGSVLTMSPSFVGSDDPRAELDPAFSVSSYHATHYYLVRGNTQEEIRAQLRGAANPLAIDRKVGTKPLGHAAFEYRYDYQSKSGTKSSTCRVKSAKLIFRFETILPQLAMPEEKSHELRKRWQPFAQRITEHEAGHHAIYRRLVTELPQLLAHIPEAPCPELEDRVRVAVEDAVNTIRLASSEYEKEFSGEAYAAASF